MFLLCRRPGTVVAMISAQEYVFPPAPMIERRFQRQGVHGP
jgi:hypothetical protein